MRRIGSAGSRSSTVVPGMGMPIEPVLFSPPGGLQTAQGLVSVRP